MIAYLFRDVQPRRAARTANDPAEDAVYSHTGYNRFLDPDGYPAVRPPWGTLNAIDLNKGEIRWQVPFGEYPKLVAQGLRNTGSDNYGGPVVTAGGLVFIAATNFDKKFRAFDKLTGKLLWETTLPAAGNATPAIYALGGRQYVVIVCGEGIKDTRGQLLGATSNSTDPAGNKVFSGAAEALRGRLIDNIGDRYFRQLRRGESAREVIFTRKVGHTQRGGRPLLFDRFYAAQQGGQAVDLLLDGQTNVIAALQWSRATGYTVTGFPVAGLLDPWGVIHPRKMHPSFFDAERMRPSALGPPLA